MLEILQTPKRAGRPRKEIDFETFEKLCFIQCTQAEICSFLGVDDKTLTRRLQEHYKMSFSEVYKKFSDGGKTSLRRTLFDHAKKNPATAIFLSKNMLGYRDAPEVQTVQVDGIVLVDPDDPRVKTADKE